MKAWFLTGPNNFTMDEVDEPQLKPGYVKVEILTAQPSVTETNMVACAGDPYGITDQIKQGKKVRLPGHEVCARIIETNEGSKFKIGDRVASVAKTTCGECDMCRMGHLRLCRSGGLLGVTVDGIFCERTILLENGLIHVPDALSDSEGANLQPLGDCVAAVESANIQIGDTVVLFGAGCLGLNTMQVARNSGAGRLIMVDVRDEALKTAKELGSDVVINAAKEDPIEIIEDLTGGIGADIIFEAAGGNPSKGLAGTAALVQAVNALKPEGKLFILAIYGAKIEFPIGSMRSLGKNLIMPKLSRPKHLEHAAKLIENRQIKIKPLIKYTLEGIESVPKAFEITGNKAKYQAIMPAQVKIK